jgi:hypothetical protein
MLGGNASEILFFLSTFFLSVFRDQGSGGGAFSEG